MGVRAGDYRAWVAGVQAKGADVLPEVVQLGIGEAASAGAGQGADRRRGGSKQVDRRGDFGQRVVHAGGVATRLDDVIAGRDEGCAHVFAGVGGRWGGFGLTVGMRECSGASMVVAEAL